MDRDLLKNQYIRSIEKKAYDKLRAVPGGSCGTYFIPVNAASGLFVDEAFKTCNFFKDEELIESIRKLKVNKGEGIMVFPSYVDEVGNNVLRIITHEKSVYSGLEIKIRSSLNFEVRDMLVNMIAYYQKPKDVNVIFYWLNSFEEIENKVNVTEI